MMNKSISVALAMALAALVVSGCAGNQPPLTMAVNTLESSKILYDGTMTALGRLHKDGILSDEDRDKVIDAGHVYVDAWVAARSALAAYKRTDDAEAGRQYAVAIAEVSRALSTFLDLANPYLLKQ